jgi:hypothetical protein
MSRSEISELGEQAGSVEQIERQERRLEYDVRANCDCDPAGAQKFLADCHPSLV